MENQFGNIKGGFSLFPLLSELSTKNMKLSWIMAKVSKLLKNGYLCFLLTFLSRIRLKREKDIFKKIPHLGLNPRPHANSYIFHLTHMTAIIGIKKLKE